MSGDGSRAQDRTCRPGAVYWRCEPSARLRPTANNNGISNTYDDRSCAPSDSKRLQSTLTPPARYSLGHEPRDPATHAAGPDRPISLDLHRISGREPTRRDLAGSPSLGGGQLRKNLKFISCITEQNSPMNRRLSILIGAIAMLPATHAPVGFTHAREWPRRAGSARAWTACAGRHRTPASGTGRTG